jgi:serralysin
LGNLLVSNGDDENPRALLSFTAPTDGTYYIDAGGTFDADGHYQLSVQTPASSYDEIADWLVSGYFGDDWHCWDVPQGGSISVNLTGLTSAGKTLARAALAEWSDIIGINFTEVLTGGQIVFDDSDSGAYTSTDWSNHVTSSAFINISTAWINAYGTSLYSYSFQTYLHEIGHALGLGHGGFYNGSAIYPDDAWFLNDAWSTTVMSYFSQAENTYFAGQGFTETFVLTPMDSDILAIQTLYGLSTTTRIGDTIYGFGSNAGQPIFNPSLYPNAAFTIFDAGGNDTIDYHSSSANQRINLNPETFSNVMGLVGNLMIARDVTIENAIGGSGNDTLIGNGAANRLVGNAGNDSLIGNGGDDTLTGGAGDDQVSGGAGGDTFLFSVGGGKDVVTDFAAGEAVTISGYDSAQSISQVGSDVVVALSGNDQITFQNTDLATVQAGLQFSPALPSTLTGTRGADVLIGGGADDILNGLAGNDKLDGGAGADTMNGGAGSDIYYVDNTGDVVTEISRGGADTVHTTIGYALGANVENGALDGSASIDLTGNSLANTLTGNDGDNFLYGMGGSDKLIGGAGNDTLRGGLGADTLSGGLGGDLFLFEAGGGNDKVTDFLSGADKIDLHLLAGVTIADLKIATGKSGTVVSVDANHDGRFDFTITLTGVTHVDTGDFVFA